MVYCISDIHGEYDKYQAILELIQFSDKDILYVLGDVIDRKPNGIDILLDIMERPNVHMLLGNHEQMCLDDLLWHEYDARRRWHNNGGIETRRDILYRRPELKNKILRFLRDLPDQLNIEVNGRKFYLTHGYPAENKDDRIWQRPEINAPAPIPDMTAIVGHTPTVYLCGKDDQSFRIWYGNGVIDIDCGCGNNTPLRRLACLRLDDMKEFYV